MRSRVVRVAAAMIGLAGSFLLAGCGGGTSEKLISKPVFTSTPTIAASEATPYSYSISAADPIGASVSYSLTAAPDGATLSGNTVSWTPSAAQSRKPNAFTVTAMTASGGSDTQSWTVSPSGTVRVSWVDTNWGADGATQIPADLSSPRNAVAALVPQSDGSVVTLTGSGGADGQLTIPNVPAGYYWLQLSRRALYRTSSSSIDLGTDSNREVSTPHTSGTFVNRGSLTLHGLEFSADGSLEISFETISQGIYGSPVSFVFEFPFPLYFPSDLDLATVKRAFILEYEGIALGAHKGRALGPAAITELSLTNEGPNNVDVQLQADPKQSLGLQIKGSAWDALFAKVGPSSPTTRSTEYGMQVQRYVESPDIKSSTLGRTVALWAPILTAYDANGKNVGSNFQGVSGIPDCYSITGGPSLTFSADIAGDEDLGTVEYRDPFPASWTRYFEFCEQGSIDISLSDGSSERVFLTNALWTASPASPVVPLIGPVVNPTINDQDLFAPATVAAKSYTLKWGKPALGAPNAYSIEVLTETTFTGRDGSPRQLLMPVSMIFTTDTNVTIPPGILVPGKNYLFRITALKDARMNVETAPRRSGIPRSVADVVSAWITIGQ